MLNFKTTNLWFGTGVVVISVLSLFLQIPSWIIISIIVAYILVIFLGSSFIQLNFFLTSLCAGNTTTKSISLTFDDGPNQHTTPLLLDILKEANIKAAFFCIGKNIAGNEEIIRRMYDEGHVIGNHSYSHSYFFDFYSKEKVCKEFEKIEGLIYNIIGEKVKLFRPPYGVTNPAIRDAVEKLDYTSIGWNIRSMDTVTKSEHKIINKIKTKMKPGSIILLHDTHTKVLTVVKELINYTKENNYEIVSLDKLLGTKAYRNHA